MGKKNRKASQDNATPSATLAAPAFVEVSAADRDAWKGVATPDHAGTIETVAEAIAWLHGNSSVYRSAEATMKAGIVDAFLLGESAGHERAAFLDSLASEVEVAIASIEDAPPASIPDAPTDALAERETSNATSDQGEATDELDSDQGDDADNPADAPKATPKQAAKTLEQFETLIVQFVEQNYSIAGKAAQFVNEFLACSEKASRSGAVNKLADVWGRHDETAFLMDSPQSALAYMRKKVNCLLRTHAAATLLGDGRGIAKGNATGRGRGRDKAGKDKRLAWGTMIELSALVWRTDDDYSETWQVLASVAEEAKALVVEIATAGLTRTDTAKAVAELRVKDAELELAAAIEEGKAGRISDARQWLRRWQDKAGLTPAAPVVETSDDDSDDDADPAPTTPAATLATPSAPTPATTTPATTPATPAATLATPSAPTPATTTPATTPATPAAPAPATTPAAPDAPATTPATPEATPTPDAPECRAKRLLVGSEDATPADAASFAVGYLKEGSDPEGAMIELFRQVALDKDFSTWVQTAAAVAYHALRERYQLPAERRDGQSAEQVVAEMKAIVDDAVMDALTQPAPTPDAPAEAAA